MRIKIYGIEALYKGNWEPIVYSKKTDDFWFGSGYSLIQFWDNRIDRDRMVRKFQRQLKKEKGTSFEDIECVRRVITSLVISEEVKE